MVFAEGGITPDRVVDVIKNNELLEALNSEDMYYKFAAQYVSQNPDGSGFVMSDDIVNQFYSFISSTDFTFNTSAETELARIKTNAEDKQYSEKVKSYISLLENELKSEKFKDFEASKSVIRHQLESEILRKYNKPENLITEAGIKDDEQLQVALSIVKDRGLYNSLLEPR